MTMNTCSPNPSPQTEKSAKHHWKTALYIANFLYALFLIRYGKLFSDTFTVPSSIFVISVFLYAGFAGLRRVSEGSSVKAYIKGHEAWALILLTIFLIAGTVFYVAFESRHDAGTGNPKTSNS